MMTSHRHRTTDPTDLALAGLNPSPARELTTAERERADASFARIVALDPVVLPTDPNPEPWTEPGTEPGRRSRRVWGRPVLLAAAAVLLAVAVIVPLSLVGGEQAYAGWTPKPVRLTGSARVAAADACLQRMDAARAPSIPAAVLRDVVIAERRGEWVYVLIRTTDEREASCMAPQRLIDNPTAEPGGWFGSGLSPDLGEPAPGPDGVSEWTSGAGATDEGLFSWTEGAVGADVVGVTLTTGSGQTVIASVADGRYAAWWPSKDGRMDSPDLTEAPTFTVTLTDGRTIPVQPR